MEKQEYSFALKGGKAIQFLLEETPKAPVYRSEDIDVIVLSTRKYHEGEYQNVAGHLVNLIKWFIELPQFGALISIQPPDEFNPRSNHTIYKLSFEAKFGKEDKKFKALMDIDFKDIPKEVGFLYDRPHKSRVGIRPLQQNVLFVSPNIGSLLNEKLFYFVKYFKYFTRIREGHTVSERYQGRHKEITSEECEYFMNKFSHALYALTEGLENTRDKARTIPTSIMLRLDHDLYAGYKLTQDEKDEIVRRIVH